MRRFLKFWLPVVLWMILIFSGSTDALSARRTSRIIGPLLRWLKPDISEATIERIHYAVRKTGHLTEYAVLALLCWRALRTPVSGPARPWHWTEALLAVGLAALYAASDELHQYFVSTREGRVADVLLDTAGGALGVFALWAVGRRRKYW